MKSIVGVLLWIIVIIIIIIVGFINYLNINEYTPEDKVIIFENKDNVDTQNILLNDTISLLTWNIGYAGLDKNMDFFYDGGKKVRTSEEQTITNLENIGDFIKKQGVEYDFLLFQEVDYGSKRSYYHNQAEIFNNLFKDYYPYNYPVINYYVKYLPFPVSEPLGKINSGLMIFSKKQPELCERYSYISNYSWPKRLWMPDRCFMVCYYNLKDGKKLIVINLHNTAFDDGGIRKKQLKQLRDFCVNQYNHGNYIIAGGDWNMCPPGTASDIFSKLPEQDFKLISIDSELFPDTWQYAYDSETPTNRYLNMPYNNNSAVATLDFYLLSPNIEVLSVKTINLDFEYSDHNPVAVKVKLLYDI
ncbi:MAG: endonuclease [Marinilabiliales bacterium]